MCHLLQKFATDVDRYGASKLSISSIPSNLAVPIAIDEYPYLKEINDSLMVDSMFQNIVDHHLSNLSLIISGSSIKTMKDLLVEGNPLFGRFDLTIKLM